jgi:prepilin peptidase CpaA
MSVYGWPVDTGLEPWVVILLGTLCCAALVTDLRRSVIPNKLTGLFGCLGMLLHGVIYGWHGLLFSAVGALAGFIVMLILYGLRGVGAGDVKLFASIGSLTGWSMMLQILFYAVLISGVIGTVWLMHLHLKKTRRPFRLLPSSGITALIYGPRPAGRREPLQFPFMLAVAPAVLLVCAFAAF